MAAPNLDLYKFITRVNTFDLARSNLFTVVFPALDNQTADTPNYGATDNGAIGEITSQVSRRLFSFGADILNSQSSLFRRIQGAYNPNLVRGITGTDYLSFIGQAADIERDIPCMVKAVNIPGENLEISPNRLRRDVHNVVTNHTNENVVLQIYLTPQHAERLYIEEWMKIIYDNTRSQVAFESQYAKTIEIFTYNRQGIAQTKTTLEKAFPVRFGPVQLDADLNNEVSIFEVEFTYTDVKKTHVQASEENTGDVPATVESIANQGINLFNNF